MAYVNVAEWKTDQVCEWLKGLDNSVLPYVHSLSNHNVNGQQLLNLRREDLDHLGVSKLGHQEIILEAVEYLRNFHYELDRENLQLLSLRLSCLTHSLFNELSRQTDSQPVSTQTLADVAFIVSAVKPLVCWLDRPPFSGQLEYNDKKAELLKLSLEMATCAQRDRFAEKPIEEIRTTCGQMAKLADYIVQDIADPMILQPASLDLATLKKRPGDDLGFCILPSFHGAHQIAEIKFGSAAHQCGKMEEGDEIVQVNYQTVVGWERKNVLELFRENPAEVLLTLKRRPRHTKVYGQIYIKPYRLPSNKKTPYTSRWHHNLPSPRPELLTIPDFTMPLPRHTPKDNPRPEPAMIDTVDMLDNIPTDSSDSDSEIEPPSSVRLYLVKPRNTVQRRATITGASPTTKHGIDIERFWRELKQEHSTSFQLRDKAASCAHGLNNVQTNLRPQTCLGIEQRKKRYSKIEEKKVQFQEKNDDSYEKEKEKDKAKESEGEAKNVDKELINSDIKVLLDKKLLDSNLDSKSNSDSKVIPDLSLKEEESTRRGRLDKSHSTPVYDFNSEEKNSIFENQFQLPANDSNEEKLEENSTKFQDSGEVKIIIGSVVQKINDIEKHMLKSNEKVYSQKIHSKRSPRESVEKSNSSEDSFSEEKEKNLSRESSEDKTESTSSYIEEDLKISTVLENERKIEEKEETEGFDETKKMEQRKEEKVLQAEEKIEISKPLKNSKFKNESIRPEIKPRLCPPEPPPRKYFSKPTTLNLGNLKQEKPKVPERPSVKKDALKKEGIPKREEEMISKKEEFPDRRRSDRFETYSDFVDKSTDFIDEPITSDFKNTILDSHSYSQIYDSYSEEKIFSNRYEPFTEKFAIRSLNESRIFNDSRTLDSRISNDSRTFDSRSDIMDSSDGPGCSKQTLEKPRTLEKDRGVVNRAMMVARSIGLHTSNKTLGSPKSCRKRNLALAKRRNISAKEISPGDLEGWLTYRSRGAGGAWAKAWFVLKGSSLFRFKAQESSKADCLIALTGFTASQATEVKSRKHAFKIYHTGTVFYFAADTEDSLLTWLDAVSKTTLGTDTVDRSSGLFSETDESDGERKVKSPETKDKGFGSLKKNGKKEQSFKEQNLPTGASLDRKYLKFLGKSQNVPVPTAQFRSYRRVLPNSTPNRKQDSTPISPELPVTVAGSTFYGLNASRSANDVPSSSQDMGDYRRTCDRSFRARRNDELQGFITLEEFMLARQDEEHQRGTPSPHFTPLTSDHIHIQHRAFDNLEGARMRFVRDIPNSNGVIYGFPKNYDESSSTNGSSYGMQTHSHTFERRANDRTRDSNENKGSTPRTFNCMRRKKTSDGAYYDSRLDNRINEQQIQARSPKIGAHSQINPVDYGCEYMGPEFRTERNNSIEMGLCQRRIAKNDVYSGSSGDLACHTLSDTLQVPKVTVTRNGSFNLADCRRDRCQEKKVSRFDKNRLKHVAQYQPPPIPNSPFEQEGMRAAFEMHLDKGEDIHKKNKLKNFFSNKSPPKQNTLETPKELQKTLLGSPRLHRALFRDKSTIQPKMKRSGSQSPGDSGISQSLSSGSASQSQTLSQSFSSVSSASDWSPDTSVPYGSKCSSGHSGCEKRFSNSRNFASPPTLPYIPPPTSPPPDYPGLEYPPVFEPGTYSLSDASLLRNRNNNKSS